MLSISYVIFCIIVSERRCSYFLTYFSFYFLLLFFYDIRFFQLFDLIYSFLSLLMSLMSMSMSYNLLLSEMRFVFWWVISIICYYEDCFRWFSVHIIIFCQCIPYNCPSYGIECSYKDNMLVLCDIHSR